MFGLGRTNHTFMKTGVIVFYLKTNDNTGKEANILNEK